MSAKFVGQRRWIKATLDKFGELEKHQPNLLNVGQDWPDWVRNLLYILVGISHPSTKFKNLKKWKAKDLGKMLGRQYAGEYLLRGQVPLSPQVLREKAISEKWLVGWLGKKQPDFDWSKFSHDYEEQDKVWKIRFKEFIKETLASACERPYIEACNFFEAFGKATVIKPNELETERTLGVGDKICWTMFFSWREIERFQSVSQLHWFFEQALKPHGITVKYKRIEKLCYRIKLKFQEGPGRPRGSKNSDKSPRSLGVISRD